MRYAFLAALFFILGVASLPAMAQALKPHNPNSPPVMAQPVKPSTPSQSQSDPKKEEIPEEYLAEAQIILRSCDRDITLRQFKNCDCLASMFLDRRIADPKKSRIMILDDLSNECIDGADAAGETYSTCINSPPLIKMYRSQENYCECVAKSYIDLFKAYGANMTSAVLTQVETQARIACSDPTKTTTLYPEDPPAPKPPQP